ncbi:hypothetical protein V1226_05940 [Lachnospiraceae bacterium JLR.KK009]
MEQGSKRKILPILLFPTMQQQLSSSPFLQNFFPSLPHIKKEYEKEKEKEGGLNLFSSF